MNHIRRPSAEDRPARDSLDDEVDSPDLRPDGGERRRYPEAFGRAAPATSLNSLPDAFGRGEPLPKAEHEPASEEHRDVANEETSKDRAHSDEAADEESEDQAPEKPPFYKRPIPMIILGIVVVGAIVAGVLWWLHARHFEKTDDAFITGHIVRIAPRVSGAALKVLVEDNQVVHQGDLLVQIDPADFQARVDQSQADLQSALGKVAEAEAAVLTAQAQVGQAQAAETSAATEAERAAADLKRYEALEARAVSQQQLDTARAASRTAQANVESARKKTAAAQAQVESSKSQVKTAQANVAEAKASLEQARLYLGYTRIVAPQDGRITNKTVEAGAYVQTGQALFSLVPRDVWIVANFKETQITDMRPGQGVTIEVDAYPDKEFKGHVDSFQSGTGAAFSLLPPENATGNYVKVVQRVPVKIVFDEPPDEHFLLGPGMSVTPKVKVR